jgi:hypothetical protein
MRGLGEQLPEAERRKIGADALAEVKQEIAAATLPRFCAMYGSELTPFIRRMNEALRSLR